MNDYELHVQDSDELGPGSDLVISMFAMAMLVVAFIGSGFGNEGTNSSRPQNDDTQELTQLRSRVSELESELKTLKSKEMPEGVIAILRDSAGTNQFQKNNTQISNDQQQQLINELRQHANSVQTNQFNTIIIEGYASPEPRLSSLTNLDTNEQLAFDRASTVAKMLVLAGIPRRCLGLMSYGRNRSEILYGINGFKPNGSEQDTKEFDNAYLKNKLLVTEDKLADERRIEIRAVSDPKYTLCTPSELAQQLSAAGLP